MIAAIQVATAYDGVALKISRSGSEILLWEDGEVVVPQERLSSMSAARVLAQRRVAERWRRRHQRAYMPVSDVVMAAYNRDTAITWQTIL